MPELLIATFALLLLATLACALSSRNAEDERQSRQQVITAPDVLLPQQVIAEIDEDTCIGCVKCVEACPVDAIVGSARLLHAVIPEYCTGCKLCLPPCPVDCITMIPHAHIT